MAKPSCNVNTPFSHHLWCSNEQFETGQITFGQFSELVLGCQDKLSKLSAADKPQWKMEDSEHMSALIRELHFYFVFVMPTNILIYKRKEKLQSKYDS